MATTERVTVTLPTALLDKVDRTERDRSRFIAEAVEHELERREQEGILLSLRNPHPQSAVLAEEGFDVWASNLPSVDDDLFDPKAGTPIRWVEGQGWVEGIEKP